MAIASYLTTLFEDAAGVITLFFKTVEFVLGFSYVCGQYLAETVAQVVLGSYNFSYNAFSTGIMIAKEFLQFAEELAKYLALCVQGVIFAVESIGVVSCDLLTFIIHFTESIANTTFNVQNWISKNTGVIFTTSCRHLRDTFALVGDYASFLVSTTMNGISSSIGFIISVPGICIKYLGNLMMKVLMVPVIILDELPPSAMIGFVIIGAIVCFFYKCKFYEVIKSTLRMFKTLLKGIFASLLLLRNIRQVVKQIRCSNSDGADEIQEKRHGLCVVCQDNPVCFISMPCKHVCLCYSCVKTLVDIDNRCPLCRGIVRKFERVYIPL